MKPSATLTVSGLVMLIVGWVISSIGQSMFAASQLNRYGNGGEGAQAAAILGLVLAAIGLVSLCMGLYRALSKIDALPLPLNAVKHNEQERSQGDNDAAELGEPGTSPPAFRI